MRAMTPVVTAGAIGSSVVIALYALFWRANRAMREMATREMATREMATRAISHTSRPARIDGRGTVSGTGRR
jgi:hypothetical protein